MVGRRYLQVLVLGALLAALGCGRAVRPAGGTPDAAPPGAGTSGSGMPASSAPSPDAAAGTGPVAAPSPEERVDLTVRGRPYTLVVPGGKAPGEVLVAEGPDGFYWALPQARAGEGLAAVKEPAVIRYTPYSQSGPIAASQAAEIYRLPLPDIANHGAQSGSLRLLRLELHGRWLYYLYSSEISGAAQPAYVALGALDTTHPTAANSPRFLFRGGASGGAHLRWAAGDHYVVWQQGQTTATGIAVTTYLLDMETGRQQALPLPGDAMTDLSLDGDTLRWHDDGGDHALALPPPGSGQLAPGARPLPAAAFNAVAGLLHGTYRGQAYLPATLPPAPFYQLAAVVEPDHYQVSFDGSHHPVPLNASAAERAQLGPDPGLAWHFGLMEGWTGGGPPPGLPGDLPPGQEFVLPVGDRQLTAHFVAGDTGRASTVWWQEGGWRYRAANYSRLWQGPGDPNIAADLAPALAAIPTGGVLVPDARGEVTMELAADHFATAVWWQQGDQWLHLGGYHYDALRGAPALVAVG